MAEIVNISYIGSGTESQAYMPKDDALITNSFIYTQFGDPNDSIEYFIYDSVGNLLDKVYNATDYTPSPGMNPTSGLYSSFTLDPQKDLLSRGYNRGTLDIQYNFLRNLFNSAYGKFYWIKEVSPTRTELKLASQNISNTDILAGFNQYQAYVAGLNYYNDFYLNFGNNQHIIAVNVAYTEDESGAYLLIKLYEPLPSDFDVKDQLWISEKIAESSRYNVDIQIEAAAIVEQNVLRGPNYNVNLNQQVAQTTPYYSYTSLSTTSVSSSFQKMMSYYQDRALEINVDYTNFSNFVHFSSINSRVENFTQKVTNIETYNRLIASQSAITDTTGITSASVVTLQNQINDIITNFDPYEYYLYFSSGSYTWPKSKSTQPYRLYSVTSSQALAWLGSETTVPTPSSLSILYSASLYDATNKDLLVNTIPQYILDDSSNAPYISFVNMIGQYFDNIWIYYKDVTNRFDATNNPNTGISLDLVADALVGLGSTLYTNSNISDNLYYSLFGINADGSLLPPTGSEKNITYVTSSLTTLSPKTIQSEVYKRIYHNIPYLYKTKGTRNAVDAITNIFGIPRSILTINEFGGYNRDLYTGLDSIYNTKITGSASTLEISASVLSPDASIQYYSTQDRLNSKNLEFGFSPADSINSTISSSRGYINIDQLIGDPGAQYSASYPALDQYQNSFFTGSQVHDIYEYIRLLKYFDNSVFKMIQDYVPARSNLSRGLIVKSHVLERNKYERHEPEMDNSMNYSQSIETITISATDAPEIQYSTAYNSQTQYTVVSPYIATGSDNVYGPVSMSNTYAWEKYTGEFGGSEIEMVTDEFSQLERSSITSPWTSSVASTQSMFTFYNEGALVNNFTKTQPSKEFVSAEYSYGIDTPINFANIVSQSACQGCGRVPCFIYLVENNGTATGSFTYQDCTDNVLSEIVPGSGSVNVCAKHDTIVNSSITSFTASLVDVCGYSYSNRTGYDVCYDTGITTGAGGNVIITYQKCDGTITGSTFAGGAGYPLGCVKNNSISLNPFSPSSNYTASIGVLCGMYSDCINYEITNTEAFRSVEFYYTDCNNNAVTSSVPLSQTLTFCGKPNSFQTGSQPPGPPAPLAWSYTLASSSVCASKCTYITNIITDPGYYSINYQKCNGDSILITGSDIGIGIPINDCIRYNTLLTTNISSVITGSESCGFYESLAEYTGSRQYAEIQDYNYHRTSAVHSKYAGAVYTQSNNVYEDWDFKATYNPRDYYVDFTGLFTEIQSSSYDPSQMVVKLPYLANISGGIQELNLQNDNWVYFQTMYRAGSNVTLKQFNSTQYSNQKYLDKTFRVVESGYSYQPYWYRKAGETDECYEVGLTGPSLLSGSVASYDRQFSPGINVPENQIRPSGSFPGYTSNDSFSTVRSGSAISASWYWYNVSMDFGSSPSYPLAVNTSNDPYNLFVNYFSGTSVTRLTGSLYIAPYSGNYKFKFSFGTIVEGVESPKLTANYKIKLDLIKNPVSSSGFLEGTVLATSTTTYGPESAGYDGLVPGEKLNAGAALNVNSVYLDANDKVAIKVSLQAGIGDPSTSAPEDIKVYGYLAKFSAQMIPFNGNFCIDPRTSANALFDTSSFTAESNTLFIAEKMNPFFSEDVTYLPSYSSGSIASSPIYATYGEVDYSTKIEEGDYIYMYYNGFSVGYTGASTSTPILRRITSVTTGSTISSFTVYPDLPGYLNSSNINTYDRIVFTKRVPDETTMILQGKKNPGKTSYGFAIPENINPTILKNANTLQSTIQSQILNY
jgi:hypothetical protein